MTDNLRTWLEERETIHGKATEGPWGTRDDGDDWPIFDAAEDYIGQSPDDGVRAGFHERDATAIVDAHNTLPKLVRGVRAVLELHTETTHGECAICFECVYDDGYEADYSPLPWPCPTVQKLQEVINDDE